MKKMIYSLAVLSCIFAACEKEDEEVAKKTSSDEMVTHGDSTTVHVFTYDKFFTNSDVLITKGDTSQISVSSVLINNLDKGTPKKGNVVVVWNKINEEPYYLRVTETSETEDRVLLNVSKAYPFEAIPDGDYKLSTDIYYNPNALRSLSNGDEYEASLYDDKEGTHHPMVIIEDRSNALMNNGSAVNSIDLQVTETDKMLRENGYIDVRELRNANASYDGTIIDINKELHPGVIGVPGMGKMIGNHGSWLGLFGGIEKLYKASDQDKFGNEFKAYVKIDTIRFRSKSTFHVEVKTSWGRPIFFEAYDHGSSDFEISNIGIGLGEACSGEHQLTYFNGKTFVFWICAVPVAIKVSPNLYFKYSYDAYALMDYRINYKKHNENTIGIRWEKDKGVTDLCKDNSTPATYKDWDNFDDFIGKTHLVFCGKASVGIYLRTSILLYNVFGPTLGLGVRADFAGEIGDEGQIDDLGNWTNHIPVDGYAKMDMAVAGELGAEVSILGKKLFNRAYDVYDFKTFNIFNYNLDSLEVFKKK